MINKQYSRSITTILFVGLLLSLITLISTASEVNVKKVTYAQGLSENTVLCINQDSLGYIWIGTREGLNRYDGYSCHSYYPTPNKQGGLRSGNIQKVFVDSASKIWVKTNVGIDEYIQSKDCFRPIEIEYEGQLISDINDVIQTDNIKWLATASKKLIGIHPLTNKVVASFEDSIAAHSFCKVDDTSFWIHHNSQVSLFDGKKQAITQSIDLPSGFGLRRWFYYKDRLWIANSRGLWLYENKQFIKFRNFINNKQSSDIQLVKSLEQVSITSLAVCDNKLWVSTDGNGVYSIELDDDIQIENIRSTKSDNSISVDAITSLYSDKDENLWLGTVHNGLNMIPSKQKSFSGLRYPKGGVQGPSGNYSSFSEDKNNQLWAASFDGLCLMDQDNMQVDKYVAKGTIINTITIDWDGNIFLGSYNKGLLKYNPQIDKLTKVLPGNVDVFKGRSVKSLLTDNDGNIWVGTRKLYCYNTAENSIESVGDTLISQVSCLLEDRHRNIWVGTLNGLYKIDNNTRRIEKFSNNSVQTFQLSANWINCLYEDSKGNIWVGTNGGGLNVVLGNNNEVQHYHNANLASQVVFGIAEDERGSIWFTTNSGLVCLQPGTRGMKVYDHTDGLINNQYISASMFMCHSGKMLCGGERGIDYFYPASINTNPTPPDVIISATVFEGDKNDNLEEEKKQRTLSNNDTLVFNYNQSYFGFGFTGIDYANPDKIQYAYRLDGFNYDWEYVKGRRKVNYGHVKPGEYTFKVRAANSDGVWSKASQVHVIVKPPFTKTPLAYVLYLMSTLLVFYLIYRYSLERKLLKSRVEFEHKERERVEELNQLKLRLFTHISHEFRTPLSLILAPVQELIRRFNGSEEAKELKIVESNANKLKQLVNQVLEVRKIESGGIQLNKQHVDIVGLVQNSCESFQHWARQKHLHLSFEAKSNQVVLSIDQELVEKVIYNLLSNAVKYTNKGFVKVQVWHDNDYCNIEVIDSGIGISKDALQRLFEMFYRADNINTQIEGSGVGLAITKELVELHHGKLMADSEVEKGSRFKVQLPMPANELTVDEAINVKASETTGIPNKEEVKKDDTKVLLVEDNQELREYFAQKMAEHYNILVAENGVQALELAKSEQPSIIISDVMMPEMDGWELCHHLKTDVTISHIPIVLLTALNESEYTIKGLKLGADAYLSKPFNVKHVLSLIKNILGNRELLKSKYKLGDTDSIDTTQLTDIDKQLLDNASSFVMEHLNHPNFSVQMLSELLGMSRVNLHMKLKALCDIAPSDFIMQIRLKEAVKLLKERKYSISEIADMTGFSTGSHFSRSFKKTYGGSPSDFLKGQIKA